MRTGLSAWILVTASFLLILGLLTREGRFVALVIPLVVYLALGVIFGSSVPAVNVSRTVETQRASEGEELKVSLQLRNDGPALEFVEIYDAVPPELEVVEGSNYLVTGLRRGELIELQYSLLLRVKGRYNLGPVTVRSRDLLGFVVHEVTLADTVPLAISPRREDIRRATVRTRRTRPWLGQIPSRSPGLGTDFWSIRDYVSGDEMRRINWKASARLDSFFTNELEGERSGDFVIILDAREEVAIGPAKENAVEMGVRAAVSLAEKLLEGRNRVGLIVMRSVLDWVYPAFGRKQFFRIVDALLSVRPGGQWTLTHLPWVLGRFFPRGCLLIVISPVVDRLAREAILNLRAYGFDVFVLSPSVLDIEAELAEKDEAARVAYSILKMERDANVALLRRFAPVADWRLEKPLALALKETERWKPGRRSAVR